ncbi:MAG: thiopurine S-methyltransferase [Kangiellaceae bacterium]|jgi:thiopurine S-methyltransferase|nr:thiopurine S-methyltransferase [Kangiellaceae bacterium]
MDPSFWHERWNNEQIGFHLDYVHPLLKRYIGRLGQQASDNVFVPLCGKSNDLAFLNQYFNKVIGVELSEKAITDFAKEHSLKFEKSRSDQFVYYINEDFEFYVGDYFAIGLSDLRNAQFVYDRASLIALPKELRLKYSAHMLSLLEKGAKILLITLSYSQNEMTGPPFSVSEEEVRVLYRNASDIDKLQCNSIIDKEPHFKSKGLSDLVESAYLITV